MAIQNLDFGTGSANDGEFLPTAFLKIQENFEDLYGRWVNILDYDDIDPTGATDSTPGFTAADADVEPGTIIFVPVGTYDLDSTPTLTRAAWLISPGASFTGAGAATIYATMRRGQYTDKGVGTNVFRWPDRMFVGAATDNDGSSDGGDSATYIQDAFLGGYYERSAQFASLSAAGGIGGLFATRTSDRYTYVYPAATVWQPNDTVSLDELLGWQGRVYQVTTAGTTHASVGPSHTSGAAANGTAALTFVDYTYVAPIGLSAVLVNDLDADGQGSWARHVLAARMSSDAGTTYGDEMNVLNLGNDVANNPYSISPSGATIGYWIAAGYDIFASANPSTCAILIGSNDNDFNKGIVFQDGSLVGPAIAMAEAQEVAWYVSGGTKRGTLTYNSSGYLALSGAVTGYSFDNELLVTKAGNTARFVNSTDSNSVQVARFEGDRATMADNDFAYVSLMLSNDAGTQSEFARIGWLGTDVNAGTNIDGALVFGVVTAGAFANKLSLDGTGLNPNASGGLSIGKSGVLWNGGWWSASSVHTWGAAEYTVTHSTGNLAFSGAITLGTDLALTEGGTGASTARAACSNLGTWHVIAASAVKVDRNSVNGAGDATETTIATVTIPAGAMGANGMIRVTEIWSMTSSANNKRVRTRFNGIGGTVYQDQTVTTSGIIRHQFSVSNRNATNSQVGNAQAMTSGGWAQANLSPQTSSVDTTAAVDIVFTTAWTGATSGETISLESYIVEVYQHA